MQFNLDEFGKMFTVHGNTEKIDVIFVKDTGHKQS